MTERGDVRLEPPRDADLEVLYGWSVNIEEIQLWSLQRSLMLFDDFAEHIRRQVRFGLFFVIRDTSAGHAIGFIEGAIQDRDSSAEFLVYLGASHRGSAKGLIGIGRFLRHVFRSYPVERLYCSVYGFNRQSLRFVKHGGFVEEGRFREYVWWRDRFWDMHVFALDRQTWQDGNNGCGPYAAAAGLLARLESASPPSTSGSPLPRRWRRERHLATVQQ